MKPTEILSSEHRVIEIILDCLDRFVDKSTSDGKVDRESAEQIVDFIRTFADGCHHGKEENYLFTAMEAKGASREHGPVGMMLHEHEQGRLYVRAMAESIAAASEGAAAAVQTFIANANGYTDLLRAHIMKEDQILFPMADRMFTDEDSKNVLDAFHHVESHHMGEGTHDRYLDLARTLAKRFDVRAEILSPENKQSTCGCSHSKSGDAAKKSNAA